MQWVIDHSVLVLTCVTTFATLVYGVATFLLWLEIRQDRRQREKQFNDEKLARKLAELQTAFYDAWGHWAGRRNAPDSKNSSQAGKVFEALIRLECLLRLNGYKTEANNLGLVIRMNLTDIDKRLSKAGVALGLLPPEYLIPPEYHPATPATVTPAKPTPERGKD